MADCIFILAIVGFFALSAAYVLGCERIVDRDLDGSDELTEVTS